MDFFFLEKSDAQPNIVEYGRIPIEKFCAKEFFQESLGRKKGTSKDGPKIF